MRNRISIGKGKIPFLLRHPPQKGLYIRRFIRLRVRPEVCVVPLCFETIVELDLEEHLGEGEEAGAVLHQVCEFPVVFGEGLAGALVDCASVGVEDNWVADVDNGDFSIWDF